MNFRQIIKLPGMILFYIFMIVGLFFLLMYPKGSIVLLINQNHHSIHDIFFKFWTYLGDGWVFLFLFLFFLLRSYIYALITVVTVVIQTIIVQGLKKLVFYDMVRPKLFFENFNELHTVTGVDINSYHAFPSGHTATAFSIALILSVFLKNRNWSIPVILTAILVGFSRVYLLQHFFIDIYFGAAIGILSALVAFLIIDRLQIKGKKPWNRALLGKV